MNRFVRIILLIIVLTFIIVTLSGCVKSYDITIYPSTAQEFQYVIDNTIPFDFSGQLLSNSDRGYRGEVYITLGTDKSYPSSDIDAFTSLDNTLIKYSDEGVKLVQLYVYLIEYYDEQLPQEALDQLTQYFLYIREKGVRVLLRFAYEYDSSSNIGPKTKQIINHCETLKLWFMENRELANDTIYAMQFGMIGLWGEGHSSVHKHNISRIAEALVDMTMDEYTIMVRTPDFLDKIPQSIEHRFSIHDDFLVGIEHPWGMLPFDHPDYIKLMNKCKFGITDGEMPWGRDNTVPEIDPILFIRQCVSYGLTSLSIEHNYIEDDNEYHLKKWQTTYITEQELIDNNFPYAPQLLQDNRISVFKYLQYHLGYLLCVSNLSINGNNIEFMLNNYGFSAPYDFCIEIITSEGISIYDLEMSDLRQYGQVKLSIVTEGDILGIRIKHKRNADITIKLANNLPYIDGINYIVF